MRRRLFSTSAPDPATDAEIADAERELGCAFPESYKRFQKEFGEGSGIIDIYGVKPLPPPMQNIVGITMSERHDCFPSMTFHLIPFSDNGGGDSYCFDTSFFESGECPVVLWDHEGIEDQQPERCGNTFLDWLEKTLKD